MSNIAIPNLPPAIALSGAELIEVVQNGASGRATTGMVAGLASGGINPTVALVAQATATITPGQFVNLYASGGNLLARPAIASAPATFANGFALTGVSSGNSGIFYGAGLNFAITVGSGSGAAQVWLSDSVAGSFQTSPPTTPGHIVQSLGVASPGAGVFFSMQPSVEL